MKRRLFQVAFSETDGERLRLHYLEFAHWIMLLLYGHKATGCKMSACLDIKRASALQSPVDEGLPFPIHSWVH